MQIARWNGHVFEVSASLVRGFTDLKIKGSTETDTKTADEQKLVYRKNGNATEISLTIRLYASLGCRVREEAMALVEEARAGACDYFVIGGAKLSERRFMLTTATVQEITISPAGAWTRAEVAVTLQESDGDGAPGGSGGSGGKGGKGGTANSEKSALRETIKEGMTAVIDKWGKGTLQEMDDPAAVRQVVRDTDAAINVPAKRASLLEKYGGGENGKLNTAYRPTTTRIVKDTK